MKRVVTLVLCCAVSCAVFSELRINEIMQSNIDGIVDDSNEFPDSWVELYNDGETAVNLQDYQLGDSEKAKKASALPQKTIAAGEYAIIYCDKDPEKGAWHADFRLESGKDGKVYLFKNKTAIDSLVEIPKMPSPNISYGRAYEGDKVGFFRHATPNAQNETKVYKKDKVLPDPVFSATGQVYTKNEYHQITISLPEDAPEGTYMRLTMDGSEPTETNGTTINSGSIYNFDKTTIFRVRLFHEDYLSPMSRTESFLFLGHETDMPVISLVGQDRFWYDDQFGILVEGKYTQGTPNYQYDWRRPVALQFFEHTGSEAVLNQICEARVQGNASRGFGLKSLAVYANKRFGEKRLSYEFFPDQKPGLKDFKSIILHNGGNDFDYLYFRDALMQKTMGLYQDIDWMASRPTIVFINGEYKGILTIRERSNEDNIYTNYNELEDITMIENWGELKSGEWEQWAAFKTFVNTPGHTRAEYEQVIDVTEFINHTILELFYANQDYPGNNIVWWRPLDAETGYKPVWRILTKDTDFGFGLYGRTPAYDMFEFMYNHDYDKDNNWANWPDNTAYFRYAMQDKDYQQEFINRALVYVGDFLRYDRVLPLLDAAVDAIQPEYSSYHRPMYNQWWPNYNDEYKIALNWLRQRHGYFVEHMGKRYNQGTAGKVKICFEDAENAEVTINGIGLSEAYWDGYWYAGREMEVRVMWNVESESESGEWKHTFTANEFPFEITITKQMSDLGRVESETGRSNKGENGRKIWTENGVKIERNGKAFNMLGIQL